MKNKGIILFLVVALFFGIFCKPVTIHALEEELTSETSEDTNNEVVLEEVKELETTELETTNNVNSLEDNTKANGSGEVILAQTVKTIITKVDEEGNPLSGAKLQVLDSEGKVVDEWTSDGKEHIVMLPDGNYKLHEVSAPEGYDLAEDKEFEIKIEVLSLNAGVDVDPYPCDHYDDGQGNYGVMLYYVEIEGKKHEVYCINQELGTPDQNSIYDGEILNTADIRKFTTQNIVIDAHNNKGDRDISDQSLNNQQLYDKLLDIIYHRHKAISKFTDLTESEIRYVTEMALKNYTNTGLTQRQRVLKANVPNNYDKYDYYETSDGKYIWYLYPMYRSFVYLPDAPLGEDIFTTSLGDGNSFGNLARHWNGGSHNAKNDPEVRKKIARYYELYNFLIQDENNDNKPDHPTDMNLYIYSTKMLHTYTYQGVEYTEPYQNLLGITGYFEEFEEQEPEKVEMVNKYSTKTVDITIKKVWDDNNNQDGKRPKSIEVTLSNGNKYTLNEDNNWSVTVKGLPLYNKGKKIEYKWTEAKIEGYDLISNITNNNITTITNKHTPEETTLNIAKKWEQIPNGEELPKEIAVYIYANGELIKTIKITKDDNWKYELANLPLYKDGKLIEYTIDEEVMDSYYPEIKGNVKEGFTLTNYYIGTGGDEEPPQTGDDAYLEVALLWIGSMLFISSRLYIKVKEN
jgi:hypothetical protein